MGEFFNTYLEIKQWLSEMNINHYLIHDDLSVTVNGSVNLSKKKLTCLPIQFKKVNGTFNIAHNQLTSLKGSPEECRSFSCQCNQLTNLIGGAINVEEYYICATNLLTSLEGAPQKAFAFDCSHNSTLQSLAYMPVYVEAFFNCGYCPIEIKEPLELIFIKNFLHTSALALSVFNIELFDECYQSGVLDIGDDKIKEKMQLLSVLCEKEIMFQATSYHFDRAGEKSGQKIKL